MSNGGFNLALMAVSMALRWLTSQATLEHVWLTCRCCGADVALLSYCCGFKRWGNAIAAWPEVGRGDGLYLGGRAGIWELDIGRVVRVPGGKVKPRAR